MTYRKILGVKNVRLKAFNKIIKCVFKKKTIRCELMRVFIIRFWSSDGESISFGVANGNCGRINIIDITKRPMEPHRKNHIVEHFRMLKATEFRTFMLN